MSADLLHAWLNAMALTSLAVVAIGILRKPLRLAVGAQAAYWLWLFVPASLVAAFLPPPSRQLWVISGPLHEHVTTAVAGVSMAVSAASAPTHSITAGLTIWLTGAFVMLLLLVNRQRTFVRSLGALTEDISGVLRSASIAAPVLVGTRRPRIIVPIDFETRYNREQRELMLVHERAHQARHDPAVNAIAAGWLCLCWFNPWMYWAVARLRVDQELACDAAVLALSRTSRRSYAELLLDTQLATESNSPVPAGCHWQSHHPLKERVAMLKYPVPGFGRRLAGSVTILALSVLGSYAVWASPPSAKSPDGGGAAIYIKMKWLIDGADVLAPADASARDIHATAGAEFVRAVSFGPGQVRETRCTPSLPNDGASSPLWKLAKPEGQSTDGMILLECKLSTNGKVFSTPALLVPEGGTGVIEAADSDSHIVFRLELSPSTSNSRATAAAR